LGKVVGQQESSEDAKEELDSNFGGEKKPEEHLTAPQQKSKIRERKLCPVFARKSGETRQRCPESGGEEYTRVRRPAGAAGIQEKEKLLLSDFTRS